MPSLNLTSVKNKIVFKWHFPKPSIMQLNTLFTIWYFWIDCTNYHLSSTNLTGISRSYFIVLFIIDDYFWHETSRWSQCHREGITQHFHYGSIFHNPCPNSMPRLVFKPSIPHIVGRPKPNIFFLPGMFSIREQCKNSHPTLVVQLIHLCLSPYTGSRTNGILKIISTKKKLQKSRKYADPYVLTSVFHSHL